MTIPEPVKIAAKGLIDIYGSDFDYLGKYEEADVYMFKFPADSCTGYPFLYLVKNGRVDEITAEPALYIIDLLVKDVDKIDVE